MSQELGDAVLVLRADDQLQGDMRRAGSTAEKSWSQSGARIAKAGAGMTIGMTMPILMFGKVAGEELGEIEKANNLTDAALRRMGEGSLVTTDGVQKLAGKLQELSGLDDQLVQMGQNAILTFAGIDTATKQGAKTFDKASRVMVDFAEASGVGVDAAGKQIAKSMAAASQGVLLLPRGMKLAGAEQAKLTKYLKSGASEADKQAAVIEVLGRKVAGAANLTNSEKWDVLKDKLAGIGAQLLTTFLPAFDQLVHYITIGAAYFDQLSPSMQTAAAVLLLVAAAVGPLLGALGSAMIVLPAVAAAIGAISLPVVAVVAALAALGAAMVFAWRNSETFRTGVIQIWNQIKTTITSVLQQLKLTLNQWISWGTTIWRNHGTAISGTLRGVWNGIRTIISGALNIIKGYFTTVLAVLRGDWSTAWEGLKTIASGVWGVLKGIVQAGGSAISGILRAAWAGIKALTSAAWKAIKQAVVDAVTSLPGKIMGGIAAVQSAAAGIGSAIIAGIMSALRAGSGQIVEYVASLGGRALSAIKSKLGIKSPSQVFADQVGKPIAEGIAVGIGKSAEAAAQAAANMAERVSAAAKKTVSKNDDDVARRARKTAKTLMGIASGLAKALQSIANEFSLKDAYYQLQAALNGGTASLDDQKKRLGDVQAEYAALQKQLEKKGLSADQKNQILGRMTQLAQEGNALNESIANYGKDEEAKKAAAQREAEELRREALGLESLAEEEHRAQLNAIRMANGLGTLESGESVSEYNDRIAAASKPAVTVNQNFYGAEPDQWAASRQASFAFKTAGLVGA